MKRNSVWRLKPALLCVMLAVSPTFADGDVAVDRVPILSALYAAPMPELAPTAVKLVEAATNQLVEPTVREVVRDSIRVNPSGALSVVGDIASAKPEMAPVAAGTAAVLLPAQAISLARAAAVSAPSQAGRIVQIVCEAAPKQYKEIVLVVAKAAPCAGKDILDGLEMALPNLKGKLTLAASACSDANCTNCIEAIVQGVGMQTAPASDPPPAGGDVVPVTSPPWVQPLTQPYFDPPGGRNYSPP